MAKLTDVVGIGPVIAKVLFAHKIKTVEALASISMSDLLKVPGFSDIRARATIKAAANCLRSETRNKPIAATSRAQITKNKTISKNSTGEKTKSQPKKNKVKDKKENKKGDKNKDKKKKNKGKSKKKS